MPKETQHENGNCVWYGFHVQYSCHHCDDTLTYLHESGEYLGAVSGSEICAAVEQTLDPEKRK